MGHVRRSLGLAGIALSIGIGVALAADGWEREFAAKIGSLDSNERYHAVKLVDATSEKGRNALYNVLATQNWHVRSAAVDLQQSEALRRAQTAWQAAARLSIRSAGDAKDY